MSVKLQKENEKKKKKNQSKISCRSLRFPSDAKFGHLTLLSSRGRYEMHERMRRAIALLRKPFV